MKNKRRVNLIVSVFQIVLILVAIAMLFLPAVKLTNDAGTTYTGFDVVFGKIETVKILVATLQYTVFEFSILNLVPYIGLVFTLVLILLMLLTKNRGSKLIDFVLFLVLLVSAVLLLLTVEFSIVGNDFTELYSALSGDNFKFSDYANLGVGAIIAGISTLLASLLSLFKCGTFDR